MEQADLAQNRQAETSATVVLVAAALAMAVAVLLGTGGGILSGEAGKIAAVVFILAQSLPVVAWLWVSGCGYGHALRRWLVPGCRFGWVVEAGLGMAALMLAHWLIGVTFRVGLAATIVVCSVGSVLFITKLVTLYQKDDPDIARSPLKLPWTFALGAAPLGLMLVAACCPPGALWRVEAYGYDALTYHLRLPHEWLEAGKISGLPHNVYSYLPSLVEAAYTMIGSLHGSMAEAVYACQLFHVSLAVFAAIGIGCVVTSFVGSKAGAVAGSVFLSVPWVMITAASAYDEMAMIAFGAVALILMVDVWSQRIGGAAAVGGLAGVATLSKLTAGPMIASPIALMLLLRLNPAIRWRQPPSWKTGLRSLGIAALAGLLTLSPYLIRNWVWTGNPVFPFAAETLGHGHWSRAQAERWSASHRFGQIPASDQLTATARQWLFNTGYGGIGGKAVQADVRDIARFAQEGGFPILWVGAVLMFASAIRRGTTRRITCAMAIMLVAQLAFWLFGTHLQSRFLLPLLLPTCIMIGLGLGRLCERTPRLRFVWPFAALALPIVLFTVSLGVLYDQVRPIPAENGQAIKPPPGLWADTLEFISHHPINTLPRHARVCIVADNGPLLYLEREAAYATPFDESPMGRAIRQADRDPEAVAEILRGAGFSHVWIGWSELDRLTTTHQFDADVTESLLRQMSAGWDEIDDFGYATLYKLPAESSGKNRKSLDPA